jgi:hypothetical protein
MPVVGTGRGDRVACGGERKLAWSWAAFQRWILADQHSRSLTRIAVNGQRFVMGADEKLTAFMKLEATIRHAGGCVAAAALKIRVTDCIRLSLCTGRAIEMQRIEKASYGRAYRCVMECGKRAFIVSH